MQGRSSSVSGTCGAKPPERARITPLTFAPPTAPAPAVCNIHNIHVVRDSYKKVVELCLSAAPPNQKEDINWSVAIAGTGWLTQIRTVLAAGLLAARNMHHYGRPVLVHCALVFAARSSLPTRVVTPHPRLHFSANRFGRVGSHCTSVLPCSGFSRSVRADSARLLLSHREGMVRVRTQVPR